MVRITLAFFPATLILPEAAAAKLLPRVHVLGTGGTISGVAPERVMLSRYRSGTVLDSGSASVTGGRAKRKLALKKRWRSPARRAGHSGMCESAAVAFPRRFQAVDAKPSFRISSGVPHANVRRGRR